MQKRRYNYKARDRNGVSISGQVEAENEKTLSHSLRELGYMVVSIQEVKGRQFRILSGIKSRFHAVKTQDIILLFRQLSAMVNAGLPLLESLNNLIEQTHNLQMKKVVVDVASDIRGGKSLSEALSHYPHLFSNFHLSMVKAGETGGMLGEVLERLAVIGYEEEELKGKIYGAFAYPVLLVAISMLIVITLLTFVLPKFITIFQESGTELPLPTVILLSISSTLRRFWYIPTIALLAGIMYLRIKLKSEKSRYYIHKKVLSLPLFGKLFLFVVISRFCKIMGALTKSGVPLLNALVVSQGILANQVLVNTISHVRQAVTGGSSLYEPLKISGLFPPMMVQMVSVGEKTGRLDTMFFQIGDFYDKESTLMIRTMTSLIEPMLLLFMGIIVAFIALSVLLPIFNLVRVLKH